MSKVFEVQRKIGSDLRHTMAETLAKSWYEAFKEFISNSYDADAENVRLTIDLENDNTTIEDDGTGMDEQGLDSFFRMGDSEKVKNPITPKGRKKIGKYGIATVLLEYLAGSYLLETWQQGRIMTVEDYFDASDSLEYLISDCKEMVQGTRITMHNLKFSNTQFSIEKLKNVLQWEMPILEDFHMYVNGEKLCQEPINPTSSYYFREELPDAGIVEGNLYYFRNGSPNPGIFVRVHGRAVGGPNYFDLNRVSRALVGKVTGTINADGLHKHISFDRSRFQEDNLAVKGVISEIYRQLRNVKNDTSEMSIRRKTEKLRQIVPQVLARTQQSVRKLDLEQISGASRQTEINTNLTEQNIGEASRASSLDFVIGDVYELDGLAVFDLKEKRVTINGSHPFFQVLKTSGIKNNLHLQFLYAASCGIGETLTKKQIGSMAKDLFAQRNKLIAQLTRMVIGSPTTLISIIGSEIGELTHHYRLNQYRLYYRSELFNKTHLDSTTVTKLISSGVLQPAQNNMFLGSDIIKAYDKLKPGYTPAFTIIRKAEEEKGGSMQRIEAKYGAIDEKLGFYMRQIEYIVDIGNTRHFFLVEDECIDKLLTIYHKDLLKRGKYKRNILPDELTKRNHSATSFVLLYDAESILGINLADILGLIDHAQIIGQQVRTLQKDGMITYSIADLKKIMQKCEYNGQKV